MKHAIDWSIAVQDQAILHEELKCLRKIFEVFSKCHCFTVVIYKTITDPCTSDVAQLSESVKYTRLASIFTLSESLATSLVHGSHNPARKTIRYSFNVRGYLWVEGVGKLAVGK